MSEASNSSAGDQENVQPNLSVVVEKSNSANISAVQNASIHGSNIPSDLSTSSSEFMPTSGTNHGGGVASSIATTAIPGAGANISILTANAGQGATSALRNAGHTSPGAVSSLTKFDQARLVFDFKNPFVAAGTGTSMLSATNSASLPSVSAASSDSQLEHDRRGAICVAEKNFSKMSAEELANSLVSGYSQAAQISRVTWTLLI